jgi:hypothetical protein
VIDISRQILKEIHGNELIEILSVVSEMKLEGSYSNVMTGDRSEVNKNFVN